MAMNVNKKYDIRRTRSTGEKVHLLAECIHKYEQPGKYLMQALSSNSTGDKTEARIFRELASHEDPLLREFHVKVVPSLNGVLRLSISLFGFQSPLYEFVEHPEATTFRGRRWSLWN